MIWDEGIETVRELIDRRAATRSHAPFLISPDTGRTVSFKEMQDQARQLHAQFRQKGLGHGDKIAFLMDNSVVTAQLFLGTMYAGFVAVPLNVRAGVSQLSYTLEHCDARVVFVDSQYEALIKDVMLHVRRHVDVILADHDTDSAGRSDHSEEEELSPVRPDDVALLMYTSGSTGQPKGVIHSHRSILAHGRNSICAHELTVVDRSLLVLPLYHINAECVTLVPTLMSGGSVVVPHRFMVSEFWNLLDDYRCTWSALVPTIISQLLVWNDPKAQSRAAAFQRIRFLRTSSAPLSPSLHREFLEKFNLPLIQAMGSTEAGNVFSNPVPPGKNKVGSPGLSWGFEVKIVDRDGVELLPGEPGEVLLRGEGLGRGYYKDPSETAAAFDAEGWLHTGDLAYSDEDGYFFVIGRAKELIIKGGMNIAPKQIDEVLETHPEVLEAAAVGVPDRYVGEDLVAFAVLREGMRCDERHLLSFCEDRLGHFKTPTRIYFVGELPKGPSGKVQRLHLIEEAERRAALAAGMSASAANNDDAQISGGAAPLPFEQMIAEIWTDLLGQPHIEAGSNFFALGGQSLLAVQCLSRLREKIPVALSLSDFFENPTVAQQVTLLHRRLSSAPRGATPEPIPPRSRSLPYPLSPSQERLWFVEQLNLREPVYNEAEAVLLHGKLDVEMLERAFNEVIARHEILRSTIEVQDGRPVAVVHENWPAKFKRVSLRHLTADARELELSRVLIDEPRRPYRLEAEPGVRAAVIESGTDEHVFILMLHHIICDRSSLGILWREMGAIYEALLRGEPSPLPPLPVQFGDYATWQSQPARQAHFEKDLAFWKENLRGAPTVVNLPADRPRPPAASYRGDKRQFELDVALTRDLRELCRQEGTSLFTVFAAVLNTLIYRYTGQDDILIGIPIADRERPELQHVIGFLIETHVLRTDVADNPTFRELLARVHLRVSGVYSHRAVPFNQVVAILQPERNASYSPVFQVMLNWRDRNDQAQFIGVPGMTCKPVLAQSKTAKFDLTMFLTDGGDKILLEVEYSTALFDQARVERMVGHLRTLLEGAVADSEQRLTELPLLTNAERHQLLVEWNAVQEYDVHS